LERIEGFDESQILDIIDDLEALLDMAPECTGFMVTFLENIVNDRIVPLIAELVSIHFRFSFND
jgi:hypothetical protein